MNIKDIKDKALVSAKKTITKINPLNKKQERFDLVLDNKKRYSRSDEIAFYQGKDTSVKGTLVLEGGAFRGIYTAGVLDCLIDNDINIDTVVGISAGALNGMNYLAGSRGRTAHGMLDYRFDSRYCGVQALKESGSVTGFKFMFEDLNEYFPINEERLLRGDKKLYAGCTNLETGKAEYIQSTDKQKFYDACRASASMPMVSKIVKIDGKKYLDGGCETKLPIRYAIENNFEKIIFIATRPLSYRRKLTTKELTLEKIIYKKYPNFIKALENANKRYNLDAEFLENLANKGGILAISPSEEVQVSRLDDDLEKLGDLYFLGYKDCTNKLPEIKKYLGIE